MDRMKGRVIWFSGSWGFICPEDCEEGDNDLFVHYSEIILEDESEWRKLDKDDLVSFVIGENRHGPMAAEVRIEKKAGE